MAFAFGSWETGPPAACCRLGTVRLSIGAGGFDDAGGSIQVLALFCVVLLGPEVSAIALPHITSAQ